MGCSNNWCIFLIIILLLCDTGCGCNNGVSRASDCGCGCNNGCGCVCVASATLGQTRNPKFALRNVHVVFLQFFLRGGVASPAVNNQERILRGV